MNAEAIEKTAELADPSSIPVRHSHNKAMSLSPAHCLAAIRRDEGDETMVQRLGSGCHAIVLGNPVIRFDGRRAGKAWDEFADKHADKTILNARAWQEAQAMASAIVMHREAMAILCDGTIVEQTIEWHWLGRKCTSRPDARGTHHLAELKTARTSNPAWFVRDALRMHYHAQCAFYDEAQFQTSGTRYSNVYIVAVEKTAPYPVTIFRVEDRALEVGRRLIRLWMEMRLACEAADEWPAYAQSIVPLDMPPEEESFAVEIDGEAIAVGG